MSEIDKELDSLRAEIVADTAEETKVEAAEEEKAEEVENTNEAETEAEEETEEKTEAEVNEDGDPVEPTNEVKPWKSKNKVSAKKRISQLTGQKRDAERKNQQLMKRLESLEKLVIGDVTKEKTKADFVDDQSYLKYVAQQEVKETVAKAHQADAIERKQEQEVRHLETLYTANVANAKKDIPDLEDVLPAFDTSIKMSEGVKKHLLGSPAGVYTMYRIANDPELNERLGNASTAEVDAIIRPLHDKIYRSLKPASQQQQVVNKNDPSSVIPTPPPRQKSGGQDGLMGLDGDDFLAAYNKKYYS